MKTIALTSSINENDLYLRRRYTDWLTQSGVLPIILPPIGDTSTIREYARRFDGFIFTGGGDIDPAYYGEETQKVCGEIHRPRDKFETALMREAVFCDKPILGICRGMQVLNVTLGGSLYQDITASGFPCHAHTKIGTPRHKVNIWGDWQSIFDSEFIVTNSYHHQSVAKAGDGLRVFARSPDGLAEGIYHPGLRFCAGVQWHPELDPDEYSEKLLQRFIREVKS